MARGADFDQKGIKKMAKAFIPILVPLFVSAFRRADELAMAMEARCYRGNVNRTSMNQLKCKFSDYIAMFIGFVFVAIVFIVNNEVWKNFGL